jgi:hypothetical protein
VLESSRGVWYSHAMTPQTLKALDHRLQHFLEDWIIACNTSWKI